MTYTTNQNFALVTLVVLVLTIVLVGPVFTIMALNQLFLLDIPLTIWTWLSVFWLQGLLVTRFNKSK